MGRILYTAGRLFCQLTIAYTLPQNLCKSRQPCQVHVDTCTVTPSVMNWVAAVYEGRQRTGLP